MTVRSPAAHVDSWYSRSAHPAPAHPRLQGRETADVVARVQGAALGARLKEIEARWLASDLRLTRSDFLD